VSANYSFRSFLLFFSSSHRPPLLVVPTLSGSGRSRALYPGSGSSSGSGSLLASQQIGVPTWRCMAGFPNEGRGYHFTLCSSFVVHRISCLTSGTMYLLIFYCSPRSWARIRSSTGIVTHILSRTYAHLCSPLPRRCRMLEPYMDKYLDEEVESAKALVRRDMPGMECSGQLFLCTSHLTCMVDVTDANYQLCFSLAILA
jgi:hypothetical protein